MSWVTQSTYSDEAVAKVSELVQLIDKERERPSNDPAFSVGFASTVDPNRILGGIASGNRRAGAALRRVWFNASVGMVWSDGERETVYLSHAPVEATFVGEGVFNWTHWVGRIPTLLQHHLDTTGEYPEQLKYGPPHMPTKVKEWPVGPWVRYGFNNGKLIEFEYRDSGGVVSEDNRPEPATSPSELAPAVHSFGLKDIIEVRDLSQDDQIRGPMAGLYLLTGGPGVGKTSVALHRIPYLLNEQQEVLPAEVPGAPSDFFGTDTMQVVVWKEHLVPYLQKSLQDLHVGDVAVRHIEDWIAKLVREYVPVGRKPGEYRITSGEAEELRDVKLGTPDAPGGRWNGFTELMLATFLNGRDANGDFHNPAAESVAEGIAELRAELTDSFDGQPIRPRFSDDLLAGSGTVAGLEARIAVVRAALDRVQGELDDTLRQLRDPKGNERQRREKGTRATDSREYERVRPVLRRARERVASVRDRLMDVVATDYPVLLGRFYTSGVARDAVAGAFDRAVSEKFATGTHERIANRQLSLADRYLLLWLVHLVTRNSVTEKPLAKPLRQWSHTVIDEAQYYHPLVLRLLIALAAPPLNSVTLVGDLEQKVSAEGGLIGWEEAGIRTDISRVFRLQTNYRWSKAVFTFLDCYRRLSGLHELKAPRRWASGMGMPPELVRHEDIEVEADWLVDRVSKLRRGGGANWSVAVVVPHTRSETWRERVITGLKQCDIGTRWAIGEDVRESGEKIILTDYNSIVGLEFDAVFLPSCEDVLPSPNPASDGMRAAWVALTRARQFVAVSHVRPIGLFDDNVFEQYRSSTSPGT